VISIREAASYRLVGEHGDQAASGTTEFEGVLTQFFLRVAMGNQPSNVLTAGGADPRKVGAK